MKVQYLTVDDVLEIHEDGLAEHGGADGVRDPGALDSAVMAPQQTYDGVPVFGSLAEIAAAYCVYIAKNHAFVDGNKRTALLAAIAFLDAHGYEIPLDEQWVDITESVATSKIGREELAELFASAMGDWGEIETVQP